VIAKDLVGGISWKLEIGKPDTLIRDLIGTDIGGRLETGRAAISDVIVLIHTVAAHTQSTDQSTVSK
jgi:hypothetical protein